MIKRRILFSGEASFLATGFSRFNLEIMKRLHSTGEFELAEIGSYAQPGAPQAQSLPWKFYGVLPVNEVEKQIYESHQTHAFGKYKIDSVLADFQPDIVFDTRDPWMVQHLVDARFRNNYKLVLTPTVDSAPQNPEWIRNIFAKADVLTTYSRFGKRVLESEGLNITAVTSPGCHLNQFKPLDRKIIREEFQMFPSLLIFGTVMRNQRRKLIPDLLDAYKRLRDKWASKQEVMRAKAKVQANKPLSRDEKRALRIDHSALYCHTSWPDLGWDIPNYLSRTQLQRHVIFTYKCEACKAIFADWFAPCDQQGLRICRICGEHAAHMPSTHSGVDESDLIKIFNLFDIYIQPAICEGWGLPIMESKACGVPGIYQNYSAMEDHVENGGGLPIEIGRFYHEAETSSIRSLPDIKDLVTKMEKLAFNDKLRLRMSKEARKCAEKMHSWDVAANTYYEIFKTMPILDRTKTWDAPPHIEVVTHERPPSDLNNQDFIAWLYINILKRAPEQKGMNDWLMTLANGGSRDEVEAFFREQVNAQNRFETIRWKHSLRLRNLPGEEIESSAINKDVLRGVLL